METVVIREAILQPRGDPAGGHAGSPLTLRVYDRTAAGGDGIFELCAEDAAGDVRFVYRDPRKFMVLEEFENTLAEYLSEYGLEAPERAAHG